MNSTETIIEGIGLMNGGGSACIEGVLRPHERWSEGVGFCIGGGSSDITRDGWDG